MENTSVIERLVIHSDCQIEQVFKTTQLFRKLWSILNGSWSLIEGGSPRKKAPSVVVKWSSITRGSYVGGSLCIDNKGCIINLLFYQRDYALCYPYQGSGV